MQFEPVLVLRTKYAVKPAHCAFSELCDTIKHLVSLDALVVANADLGRINERNSCTFTETYGI